MSNKLMFKVGLDFDLDSFANNFVGIYHARAMIQNHQQIKGSHFIDINQGNEGFTKYIGLGANIRVSLILIDDVLHVNFSDADWTGKVFAYILSPFTCSITLITGIIGIIKQLELPRKIKDDILHQLAGNQQGAANPFNSPTYTAPAPTYTQPSSNCTNCGAALNPDSSFCTSCGNKV